MSGELVARLRNHEDQVDYDALVEAADRIEELEAERDSWRAIADQLADSLTDQSDQRLTKRRHAVTAYRAAVHESDETRPVTEHGIVGGMYRESEGHSPEASKYYESAQKIADETRKSED